MSSLDCAPASCKRWSGGVPTSRDSAPASQPLTRLRKRFVISPGCEANPRGTKLHRKSASVSEGLLDSMLREPERQTRLAECEPHDGEIVQVEGSERRAGRSRAVEANAREAGSSARELVSDVRMGGNLALLKKAQHDGVRVRAESLVDHPSGHRPDHRITPPNDLGFSGRRSRSAAPTGQAPCTDDAG